ncbi:MAG: CDP-diacylglycerol--serine O-phosphatidyltransferase [Muribaculaceae bacterium]|uniref:CDP-diacylglycerol--serine O-phosphatidyltransferase n=1 Tax=Duncaniella dubosii TaxID=2518971 RepID=UPI000E9495FF|nr:CDP-diacylglycerol--serine O-phosphatidyltransferase [Duncaniella dubosii]MBJ2191212.1 CDP-diacylglycerol--serine O-phosphatidyltransferase [Muribaculaceae bacterium]MCX4284266.1 CDP-diacylglycerol--serine O-phosphatidyltransferase [Duncaniella dubosii]HBN64030.1 CDP-diacylglycerol--serine O-phosphatidyltransferase [Porphyromonadaceae bacterium]
MKSLKSYIPNTITCLNLLSGCAAVFFAFNLGMETGSLSPMSWAFIFIGAAAVFDFCDGLSARLLHAYSPVGKELDSLSDLVSFGLAPAFLVMNSMQAYGASVWVSAIALFIAVMGALRLAKFNVDTRQATSFIGLPIPANAIFWIGALAWIDSHAYPGDIVMALLIVAISLLMVSELRMFSLKFANLSWRGNVRRYVVLAAAVFFVITEGISGFAWTIVLYILISLFGKKAEAES